MKSPISSSSKAFTLMETVIAIGVVALLLTGFLAVFAPATFNIRKSISSQQANRLTSTLERELVAVRTGQLPAVTNGFDKAFDWIRNGNDADLPVFIYQYRGNTASIRADGTPTPVSAVSGQPGNNYTSQTMVRRIDDPLFTQDIAAIDGPIFYVKNTQLIYSANQMILGTKGQILNPNMSSDPPIPNPASYPDAVIAFSAEFYSVPSKSISYLTGNRFKDRFNNVNNKPVFTRNLAIRR